MKDEFLNYLYSENFITEEQKRLLLEPNDDTVVNYDLLMGNFLLLETSQIPEPVLKCVQVIIDSDLIPLEEIEGILLNYELDRVVEDHTVKLTEAELKDVTAAFVEAYLSNFSLNSKALLENELLQGNTEVVDNFHFNCMFSQKLEGVQNFLVGIAGDKDVFRNMAEEIYDKIMPGDYTGLFSGDKEDVIDAILEFLNNVNSSSSYGFNPGFDLHIPEYFENVSIHTEEIYKIGFTISGNGNCFDLIIVPNWNYHLK